MRMAMVTERKQNQAVCMCSKDGKKWTQSFVSAANRIRGVAAFHKLVRLEGFY
jgi:hypothetical protein